MTRTDYTHRIDTLNACNTATPSSLGCAGLCASFTSRISKTLLMCSLVSQIGCATDKRLAPPADSEMVTVQVVLPPELMPKTITINYRSAECPITRRDSDLSRYQVDGYNNYEGKWEHDPETGTYEVRIPKDGGGTCKWRLDSFRYWLTYTDAAPFGAGLEAKSGSRVKISFERPEVYSYVRNIIDGDVRVHAELYPWILEAKKFGWNWLSLVGGGFEYYAPDASLIRYEVSFYRDWLTRRESAEKKGDPHTYYYPDGSVVRSRSSAPGILKLQTSRTGRNLNCFMTSRYERCPDARPSLSPYPIPVPNRPGFKYYVIVDEWGNPLTGPMLYRILGADGKKYEGIRQAKSYTQPIPDSALPFVSIDFPRRNLVENF